MEGRTVLDPVQYGCFDSGERLAYRLRVSLSLSLSLFLRQPGQPHHKIRAEEIRDGGCPDW